VLVRRLAVEHVPDGFGGAAFGCGHDDAAIVSVRLSGKLACSSQASRLARSV
jgi:hypothetical protein